jgi:hypothetical protein
MAVTNADGILMNNIFVSLGVALLVLDIPPKLEEKRI